MAAKMHPETTPTGADEQAPVCSIREIKPADTAGLDTMAQFGDRFIREMCYATPMHDGLLRVALVEVDNQPAGFIAYTGQAQIFYQAQFRHHLIRAGWMVGLALLQAPRRLLHIPRVIQVLLARDKLPDSYENTQAEVLCIGVRPQYLTPAFVRKSGQRISRMLLDHAFSQLRSNYDRVRMVVDADNRPALFFYHGLGADLTPCQYGGVPSVLVLFDLEADTAADGESQPTES
jgi:ribosomal protein S18 acetylase RimI-like enzyme